MNKIINGADVDIWVIPLSERSLEIENLYATLSATEQLRADSYFFLEDRNCFISGRFAVRQILSLYLHESPKNIQIVTDVYGHPSVSQSHLQFSFSNTHGLGLLAVSKIGRVGVDVEKIRGVSHADNIVANEFDSLEKEIYQNAADANKNSIFLTLFTRKESRLKALGKGFHKTSDSPLELFTVDLSIGKDYVAALTTAVPEVKMSLKKFNFTDITIGQTSSLKF